MLEDGSRAERSGAERSGAAAHGSFCLELSDISKVSFPGIFSTCFSCIDLFANVLDVCAGTGASDPLSGNRIIRLTCTLT